MFWHIIKFYLCFVIAAYFKRYQTKNQHYVSVKGPVILAINHPNGFMDPVAVSAIVFPPRVRYLARGDAFKKGIITWILESLGVIPIFRIQDGGKEGLKKNNETYNIVNRLLKRNKKIMIFAEGLCINERRLRPLKKGVPRMLFGAMEEVDIPNLTVVPVGLNYSMPTQFRSKLFLNFGEPMLMADYMTAYKDSPAKTMNNFVVELTKNMKALIVNIDFKHHETVIENLEKIYKSTYFNKHKLNKNNLEHDFILSNYIANKFNSLESNKSDAIESLSLKSTHYLNELNKLNLKDWLVCDENDKQNHFLWLVFHFIILSIAFPLYIIGFIGNYLPYIITHIFVKKKVKLIEFKASFHLGVGSLLFLINYILLFFIPNAFAPSNWWGLLSIVTFSFCGMICLNLTPIIKKTAGMCRYLNLKSKNKNKIDTLKKQRQEIISDFETLTMAV